jgi:pimeloyl-ACP methyl ester carboxylesterase
MDFMTLQTPAGAFGVVGRLHAGPARPALLAVNGAFPRKHQRHDLVDHFPGVSVLVVELPGMSGVAWANPTIPELTQALENAVRRLVGDVPIVAFGSSASGLVTLGLQLPNICRHLVQEPFFETGNLWPFVDNARARMARNPDNAAMTRFFWEVFGIGPDRLENRDYRRLLANITKPTDVIVGGAPLEPKREMDFWPSFTSARDRAALRANPLVSLFEGPPDTGHSFGVEGEGDLLIKRMLHAALREAAKLCG